MPLPQGDTRGGRLKRKAAGDDLASSAESRREPSNADCARFLRLKSVEFVLSCLLSVEATPAEYINVKELLLPLTEFIERSWAELAVNLVSLGPGLEKLSAASSLIGDYIANKPEGDLSFNQMLFSTINDLPRSFLRKIHHHLDKVEINSDNAWGACILLRNYHERPNSIGQATVNKVREWNLHSEHFWWYLVTARHVLKHPLATSAFKTLSKEVAARVMKKYGHPSSWHGSRHDLQRMQADTESRVCTTHHNLLIILNHFELEGDVKILPSHINRAEKNFLLDPVNLIHIRSYFANKEIADRRASLCQQKA